MGCAGKGVIHIVMACLVYSRLNSAMERPGRDTEQLSCAWGLELPVGEDLRKRVGGLTDHSGVGVPVVRQR